VRLIVETVSTDDRLSPLSNFATVDWSRPASSTNVICKKLSRGFHLFASDYAVHLSLTPPAQGETI
jgi:hypothetical protein